MAKSGEWVGWNKMRIPPHCRYFFTVCSLIACNVLYIQDDTCMIFADQGIELISLINR